MVEYGLPYQKCPEFGLKAAFKMGSGKKKDFILKVKLDLPQNKSL